MATSAIGPGFLTQTATFTQALAASFGFVILLSILLDIGAQLNIWRIVAVSEKQAQDIANQVLPGAGYFLAVLIVMGGLAFNIGNVGGAGLGLNLLTGLSPETGAVISGVIAIGVFLFKEAGKVMDKFAQVMGFVMIALTVYVAWQANPPLADAAVHTFMPEKLDAMAIVTLVGGTVGGYITFAVRTVCWTQVSKANRVAGSEPKLGAGDPDCLDYADCIVFGGFGRGQPRRTAQSRQPCFHTV